MKGQLKRVNSARQQRNKARDRLAGLVGECSGLVLCGGEVVVRPVQRFVEVRQMRELAGQVMSDTMTKKLDGVVVHVWGSYWGCNRALVAWWLDRAGSECN